MAIKTIIASVTALGISFAGMNASYATENGGPLEPTAATTSTVKWEGVTSGSVHGGDTLTIPVLAGEGFVNASMQGNHTLAYDQDGTLWGWGSNQNHVLGQADEKLIWDTPRKIDLDPDIEGKIVDVSAGGTFSLAMGEIDGQLDPLGWGNTPGLMTAPGYFSFGLPTLFTSIDAGVSHGIGIAGWLSDPEYINAYTWGTNSLGELGNSGQAIDPEDGIAMVKSVDGNRISPALVAAGGGFSLLLDDSGILWTWGKNLAYPDDPTGFPIPFNDESEPYKFTQMSAGEGYALAVDDQGSIWGWGANDAGQVGDGTFIDYVKAPKKLTIPGAPAGGFKQVAAGSLHSVAVDVEGGVWAWGDNAFGQLANGSDINNRQSTPQKIDMGLFPQGTTFRSVAASENGSLFISDRGVVWGVGSNASGQLGNGLRTGKQLDPVPAKLQESTATVYFGKDDAVGITYAIDPETKTVQVDTPQHMSGPMEVFLKVGTGPEESLGIFTYTVDLKVTADPSATVAGENITLTAMVDPKDVALLDPTTTVDFATVAPVSGVGSLTGINLGSGTASVTVTAPQDAINSVVTAQAKHVVNGNYLVSNLAETVVTFETLTPVCGATQSALSIVEPTDRKALANGNDTYTAQVKVVDQNGQPMSGIAVKFTADGTLTNVGGPVVTTDSSGIAQIKYVSQASGNYNVSASLVDYPDCALGNSPATVEFLPAVPVLGGSSFTVDSVEKTVSAVNPLPTDSAYYVEAQVVLSDFLGYPVENLTEAQFNSFVSATSSPDNLITFFGVTGGKDGVYSVKMATTRAGDHGISFAIADGDLPVAPDGNRIARFKAGAPYFQDCLDAETCTSTRLAVSEESAEANGSAALWAEVTVVDEFGNPITGADVDFDLPDDVVALSSTTVTSADGKARLEFTSTKAGDYEIRARISGTEVALSPQTVTFVAGAGIPTYVVSSDKVVADGNESVLITVTSQDALGNPADLDPALLSASSATASSATTFGPFTGANGVYTAQITSTQAGVFDVVVAYDKDSNAVTLAGNGQATFVAGVPDFSNSKTRIFGDPVAATVGGSRTVTAQIYDAHSNPVSDATVTFSHPVLGEQTAVTVDGVATVSYTTTTAGTFDVTGAVDAQTINFGDPGTNPAAGRIFFVAGLASVLNSEFSVGTNSAVANGSDAVELLVTLRDQYDNPVLDYAPGYSMSLVAQSNPADGVSLAGNIYTSQGEGKYTLPITSLKSGDKVIGVALDGTQIGANGNRTAIFVAGPVSLAHSSFTVTNTADVKADGESAQTLSVTLRDVNLNPVVGDATSLSATGNPDALLFAGLSGVFTDEGEGLYRSAVTTTVAGQYTVGVTYGAAGVVAPVSAGADVTTFVTGVPFYGPCEDGTECEVTRLEIVGSPAIANGSQAVTATVTVVDAFGNLIDGTPVVFGVTGAPTPSTTNAVTSVNGKAQVTYTSTQSGTFPVTATIGGTSVNNSPADIEFTPGSGVPVYSVSQIANIVADGVQVQTITVKAVDANNNPLTITASELDASSTGGEDFLTISGFAPVGGNSGLFEATVSSTKADSFPIAVTYNGAAVGLDGNHIATFVAGAPDMSNQKTAIRGQSGAAIANSGQTRIVTATVVDKFDNPVPGATVNLEHAAPGLSPETGVNATTNVDGIATVEFTSTEIGRPLVSGTVTKGSTIDAPFQWGDINAADGKPAYAQIEFVADVPTGSASEYVVSQNADVYANGSDIQTVTVTLKDAWGNLTTLPLSWTLSASSELAGVDIPALQGEENGSTYSGTITASRPDTYPITVSLLPKSLVPEAVTAGGNTHAVFLALTSKPPVIDEVTDEKVSGKDGVPGAEIAVTDPITGEDLCKNSPVVVGADGTWSCEFKETVGPDTEFEVVQTEDGKLPSEPVVGVTPPAPGVSEKPVIDEVTDLGVSGKGVPGAEITVSGPGGEVLCTATVSGDGTWSCEFASPQAPDTEFEVVQTEDGKLPSEPTPGVTPPAPGVSEKPVIDTVTDLGVSGKGVPGAEITVSGPGGEVLCTATVSGDGTWSCEFASPQLPGTVIEVVQSEDGKLPSEPAQGQVPDRSKPPVIDQVTDEKVTGKDGEPGSEITVTDPETGENLCKEEKVVVGPDGTWTCTLKDDVEPDTEFEVVAKEDGKLPSEPTPGVTPPAPGVSEKPVIDTVTDLGVSGKGVPGAEITVSGPGGEVLCTATVSEDGTWSCEFASPQAPDTEIEVVQTEDGKLPSEPVVGVTPPAPGVSEKPVIDEVTDEKVSGKDGVPGAEIAVTDPITGEDLCKNSPVVVGADGTWSCEFKETVGPDTEFEVVQTEDGKLPSEPVVGVTPPAPGVSEKPVIDEVTDLGVSGKGVPGAEITVSGPGGEVLCTATVSGDGTWSCEFASPQAPDTEFEVVQTEDGKLPSEPTPGVTPPAPGVSEKPVIDTVTDLGVSGKGVPGAEITVSGPGGEVLCTATVSGDGTWSCEFASPQLPGTVIEVVQSEDGKLPSEPAQGQVPDRSKPPVIDQVTDEKVTGKDGEPGAEITVTDPETGENLCKEEKVVVGPDGTWTCTLKDDVEPDTEFEVVAKEDGKLPSEPTPGVTPPAPDTSKPPVIDQVTDEKVTGKDGEPGAEITVTDPETGENLCKEEKVIVGPDGTWSCDFKEPQDPGTEIDVNQKEDGKDPSDTVTVVVPTPDTSKPPVIDEVTDEKVTGKDGEPGAEITVTDPETGESLCKEEKVVVGPDGTWTCTLKDDVEPDTEFEVEAKEQGKEPSEKVPGVTPPAPTSPEVSKPPTDLEVDENGASGKGEPDAEITVTDPDTGEELCKTTVDKDGNWTCEFTGPQTPGKEVEVAQKEKDKEPSGPIAGKVPDAEFQIVRYSGADRYGTSLDLNSRRLVPGKPVFVATGANFPDSLSAGPAVTINEGSLVLSNKGTMSSAMLKHIEAAKPSMVYIIGQTGALSKNVEKQLTDKFGTAKVKRVGGSDRYETSSMIASEFFKAKDLEMAFVASGQNFPDALTASAAGGALGAPVLLASGANAQMLRPSMTTFLNGESVKELVIAGGTVAIGADLERKLRADGFTVDRQGGKDRYGTNLLINALLDKKFPNVSLRGVWLAAGANFPDALSAAVPAGKSDQRLVLSKKNCVTAPVVTEWIFGAQSKVSFVGIVGGTAVLNKNFDDIDLLKKSQCPQ